MSKRLSAGLLLLLVASLVVTHCVRFRLGTSWLPVEVELSGAAETASLHFGPGADDVVPLVPFEPGSCRYVGAVPGARMEMVRVRTGGSSHPELRSVTFDTHVLGGGELRVGADAFVREDDMTTLVRLPHPLNAPLPWLQRMGMVSTTLFMLGLALAACLSAAGMQGQAAPQPRPLSPCWPVVIAAALIGIAYTIHAIVAPVVYTGGDSNWYLVKAKVLLSHFSFHSGQANYQLNKMPGVPLFYAFVQATLGRNALFLSLAQHWVLVLGYYALGRSLQRHVSTWLALATMVLVAISPVQIYYASSILSESLFSASVIFLVAVLLRIPGASSTRGRIALYIVGGGVCAIIAFIRINGVLSLLPLSFLLWCDFRDGRFSLRGTLAVGGACGLIVVVPLCLWTLRNYVRYQIPAPMDQRGVQMFNGAVNQGYFDPRIDEFAPFYADFSRMLALRSPFAWPLRSVIYQQEVRPSADPYAVVREVEEKFGSFTSSSARHQRAAYYTGLLRSVWLGTWQPDIVDAAYEIQNHCHKFGVPDDNSMLWAVTHIKDSSAKNYYVPRDRKTWPNRMFHWWHLQYLIFFRAVMIVAVGLAFIALSRSRFTPVSGAILGVFLLNLLFVSIVAQTPYARYIMIIDHVLIVVIALQISSLSSQILHHQPPRTTATHEQ